MTRVTRILALASAIAALVAACAVYDGPARISAEAPDRAAFASVAPLLVDRCGSLDCHGSIYRSYRLYGVFGARLDAAHRPDSPATTPAEIAADYDATVSLEPEIVARVASGAATAGELTLVRKATGAEQHAGGARLPSGSDGERCLVAWLARRADDDACRRAVAAP
ncbi:MAG: hypothetical protein KF819_39100 [Labilithrix sp.]|nr:hypothetical protein [Labilithrix sp.]